MNTSLLEHPSAGLLRRSAAMVYDLMILIAIWMAIGFVHAAIVGPESITGGGPSLQLTLFPLLLSGTFMFYYWFWTHGGQTLGMRAWRLKVVDSNLDGRPLSFSSCVVRFSSAILSLLCLGLGYITVLFNPEKNTWHDNLSNTRTLVMPKQQR